MTTLGNIPDAHSYKKRTPPSDTPNKNGTQQKKNSVMSFENRGTLQKWHMTNTPPKIDKYDTHKKLCLTTMAQLAKNAQTSFAKG